VFEGFLPVKKGRRTRLDELKAERRTLVILESPHRVVRTFSDLAEAFGDDRRASASREISKLHEETVRGTLPNWSLTSRHKSREASSCWWWPVLNRERG
jgi:16S rRNA (cytidine1402-2'-O)-methyltransferase